MRLAMIMLSERRQATGLVLHSRKIHMFSANRLNQLRSNAFLKDRKNLLMLWMRRIGIRFIRRVERKVGVGIGKKFR